MLTSIFKCAISATIGMLFGVMLFVQIPEVNAQATPIPKTGSDCPFGYYKSGDYCMPFKKAKPAIEREGKDCPRGWYMSSGYCKLL